jgi:hypothetical protein
MRKNICALLFAATVLVCGAAEPFRISRDAMPRIVVGEGMRPFVSRAAADVAGDMAKAFGVRPQVVTGSVAAANAIVLAKGGDGWENYSIESEAGNVLRITGSDDRGVMFGLYRFASECLGVDPFYRWSGREPEKTSERTWKGISIRQGDPSFRFRAWFINDEDFLNGFRPEENGKRAIDYPRYHVCFGPKLADEIYETAVRAGFNAIICASYVDILNPDEKRLVDVASARGLYITTHHQEPVGAGALQLDLHFPEMKGTTYASHPDLWRKAWKRYVGEWAKVPDVIWQLGLRGRRDKPFWMKNEEWKSPDVPEEEDRRRAGLISSAMAEQLAMIEEALGRRPEHFATQLWMEGAEYYRRGLLSIPDGATIIFSDNCPGLKFQSDIGGVESLDRSKRFGLYYHLALVHGNHRCELVPPLRTHQVLGDAWRKGARELVLFNVSNVRPFLYTLAAAGKMSADLGGFDAAKFRDAWAAERFGERAPAVARAIDLYFGAYETVLSRDGKSSYGSPRERAPLAILNDGMLCSDVSMMIRQLAAPKRPSVPAIVSQYVEDPDRLTVIPADLHRRVNQDMFPIFQDNARAGLRARTQSAAFARCMEQIERASKGMSETQQRQLFERFGYPAEFLRMSSDIYAELSAAREAKGSEDAAACRRHLQAALGHAEARDALDRRYNEGRWKRWYDRDLIYPCATVSADIRRLLVAYDPPVLRMPDGTRISSAQDWQRKARAQIIDFFDRNIYGHLPPKPAKLAFELLEKGEAFGGVAERRQYAVRSADACGEHVFDVLVYLPKGTSAPLPAFVYPNFSGNHSLVDDPAVRLFNGHPYGGKVRSRGERKDRAPVEEIVKGGFAFVTFCYGAIYPDYAPSKRDAAPESVWTIFPKERWPEEVLAHPTWSWGSMRVRDLLETLPEIDQRKVAIAGQSRMGKNAIETGVHDERFSLVCANCGGTKSLKFLPNLIFPHWFSRNLQKYVMINKTGQTLEALKAAAAKRPDPPFDQSAFIGCIAPRAMVVSTATEDTTSRPEASQELLREAEPVFALFGKKIGWHLKKGAHSITHEDWRWFMDYARRELKW